MPKKSVPKAAKTKPNTRFRLDPKPRALLESQAEAMGINSSVCSRLISSFRNRLSFRKEFSNRDDFERWEKLFTYCTAVGFALLMLFLGVFVREFTAPGFFIVRTILSLVSGAFAAVLIPGIFRIEGRIGRTSIQVIGAAVFFWVVFSLNPPELLSNSNECHIPSTSQQWKAVAISGE